MKHKKIEIEKLDLPFEMQNERAQFIKVECPSCSEQVSAVNIDLESKMGKVGNCNAVFSVKKTIVELQKFSSNDDKIERPQGIESFDFRNELEIELDQPFPMFDIIILSIFPFVLMFALLFYFLKDMNGALPVALIALLISVKSIIRLIRQKQHKILLSINEEKTHVQCRPKNLKREKSFDVSNLDQVYVAQTTDGVGLFFIMNGEDGQRHEKVLGRMRNIIHAKYIEQEIEKYLEIRNRKITGEI